MSWRVVSRPEVESDITGAAAWYETQQRGLGADFVRELEATYLALCENPFLNAKKHRVKPVRWRVTHRFPYRVIYEVDETEKRVIILAVLHAARHDRRWQQRIF